MKFSVIIPIYNCEQYLKDCLDSVRNQTYRDWECICVDDGSTDNSGKIADEYAIIDDRFKVIHTANGGEGAARNVGLEMFSGNWVYFLDSDDILNIRTLEMCRKGISLYTDVDLISIKTIRFNDGNECTWNTVSPVTWQYLDISTKIDSRSYGMPVWSIAYKAELVRHKRFSSLKIGADRVFVIDVIEDASKIAMVDYIGYGYRTRIGSAVNTPMTAVKFLADLQHRMFCVETFANSKKQYDRHLIDSFAKQFTEYMAYCYFSMSSSDQKKVLSIWSADMLKASQLLKCNSLRRMMLKFCGLSNSRIIYRILCYLPYWLKIHGVNRQFAVMPK